MGNIRGHLPEIICHPQVFAQFLLTSDFLHGVFAPENLSDNLLNLNLQMFGRVICMLVSDFFLITIKTSFRRYVFAFLESPVSGYFNRYPHFESFFNWSATYR